MGCGTSKPVEEPFLEPLYINGNYHQPDIVPPPTESPNNEQPHYIQLPGMIPLGTNEPNELNPAHQDSERKSRNDSKISDSSEKRSSTDLPRRKSSGGKYKSKRSKSRSTSNHYHRSHHSRPTYVALFDYKARSGQDINFHKGDLMELLDDKNDEDWRQAHHFISKTTGLVPSAYIAKHGSLESKDWFFDKMSRREAETLLLSDQNIAGTFMVRRSEQSADIFSLSIKCKTSQKGMHAKHYRTRYDEKNKYCIFPGKHFETLNELIEFYSKHNEKLPTVLIKPCPKPVPQLWDLAPELARQWEIPKSELRLLKKVGVGQFGEVWYGKWNKTIQVAIKTCKPESMTMEDFLAEAAIMKQFRHPRLVALYAVCTNEPPIYIVTEFMKNGSLLDYMKKNGPKITFSHLIYIALQIAEGMSYLESKQLVHRDLAARNVLIGENNSAKIADFGLARVINRDAQCKRQTKPELLPIKWSALEVIKDNQYSTKSDVWSFGIVMMELFTYGEKPYGEWTTQYTIFKLEKGYRLPKPEHMPNMLYEALLKCWDVDPMSRPTFEFLAEFFEAYTIGTEGQYHEEPDQVVYANQPVKSSTKHRHK